MATNPIYTSRKMTGLAPPLSKQFFNHPTKVNTLSRTYQVAEGCGRVCSKEGKPSHAPSTYRDRPSDFLRDGLWTMRMGIFCPPG